MEAEKSLERCPHCGVKLSAWQQVLLSVDRAIMCKNCWYKIILDQSTSNDLKVDEKQKQKNLKEQKNGNI